MQEALQVPLALHFGKKGLGFIELCVCVCVCVCVYVRAN
jgi:hypothetical protein